MDDNSIVVDLQICAIPRLIIVEEVENVWVKTYRDVDGKL